ncbi:hypothetical protein RKD18_002055 [Streptomyces phaeoluteigriseus]
MREPTYTTTPSGSSATSGRGSGTGVLVREPPHEVVLDDEGPRLSGDAQHLTAPGRGQDGAGRVLEQRLADEDPGAGGAEGVGEQLGLHAVGVDRHRYRTQPRGPGDRQHARIRRRLDEHRGAGRGQRAQRGGERGLAP